MLKQLFFQLVTSFTADTGLTETLWVEIEREYSRKKRHYHNLTHLENLYEELSAVRHLISDWDIVLFAMFYHDVVYNVLRQDNEERSATLAEKRLRTLGVQPERITLCCACITATKQHSLSPDQDINFFTDADLSILGKDWNTYLNYTQLIRKEYSVYPALVYNPGRKKVLHHFLNMNQIFKTTLFCEKYEAQARQNLACEIELL